MKIGWDPIDELDDDDMPPWCWIVILVVAIFCAIATLS